MAPRDSESPVKKGTAEKKKVVTKEEKPAGKDIRNFPGPSSSSTSTKASASARTTGGTGVITIDDSDDEAPIKAKPIAKVSSSKPAPARPSGVKVEKSAISISPSASPPPKASSSKPLKASPAKPLAKASTSASASSSKPRASMSAKRLIDSDSDEEDTKPPIKKQAVAASKSKSAKRNFMASSEEDEEEDYKPKKPTPSGKAAGKAKREPSPMEIDDDDEDDFIEEDKPKKAVKPKAKATPKKAAAKSDTVKKPAVKKEKKEKEEDGEKKPAFNWRAAQAAKAAGPRAPGSKEIPEGAPNCMADLAFVFTGELSNLGRDEAIELVKRYSGKVTGAPSGKTDYIVVGENAGESKMKKIRELQGPVLDKQTKEMVPRDKVPVIVNEDEFYNLIAILSEGKTKRAPEMTAAQLKARQKEEEKIRDQAKEMERREKDEDDQRRRKERALEKTGVASKKTYSATSQLWTTKYAPQNVKEICGNKGQVEKILTWLQGWDAGYKCNFKKPGKDGMGLSRAILISGPPGIGKTTSAHLMAKMAGYSPIELNASDVRSKKLIENSTNIDNASLDGFFAGGGVESTTVMGVRVGKKACLIMDEVDGMSAGDRGGVGALNILIKKTRIPLILICNDRSLQKMKPLHHTTFDMKFRRPQPAEVRSRIMTILFKEKMKIPANVVDELIKGAGSDIRQVLNMLSTFKLSKAEMDFDEGKALVLANQKNTVMTPFTIIDKLTAPYAFSRTNKETLNDKADLYFLDFSWVPLFMQEHYLKTTPAATNQCDGPEKALRHLELASKAADWISDGDLVDRLIHSSEQQWSLLPLHAMVSTVAPASLIYGPGRNTGGSGWGGPSFPQWMGQNSKQTKLSRMLTDIQIRMRLRVSGSRQEIREQYMPMLASKIVLPLKDRGGDAIEETIACMDEYYLGKDDWEAFVELGVGEMKDELILKHIPTAVKSSFTRIYNKADHPIAFHKGDMFAASKKKVTDDGAAPDNDEVFEDDAPVEDEADGKEDSGGENDVSKDKLIKAVKPKLKKAAAGTAAAPKKAVKKK